ncbi:MAG: glycosyltransferase [Elusimicrobium sp.]|jgi:glycosyltransferase involved in cell wall biosynthesis|nr:glycosyltransferase [Elusimicrobium sp.]
MSKRGKIKILYIITRMDTGGAQKSVLYSAQNLPENFTAFLAAGPGGAFESLASRGLKNNFFIIKSLRQKISPLNILHDVIAVLQTGRIMLKIRPHIIHTNTPKAGIIGRAAAYIFWPRAKVAHTYHGLGFSVYGGKKRYRFYAALEKMWALITRRLIFVSSSNMEEAKRLRIGGAKKNVLIYPGALFENLPRGFDKTKKLDALGVKGPAKIVLSCGNFKPEKNARDFVLAAAAVVKKMPDVYFLYAGAGGSEEGAVKNLAKKLNLKKNLMFLGARQDVRELLGIADLYVSASLREGLPVALIEALGAGVPAVCYAADGTAEILKNNRSGLLAPKGNREYLEAKILRVLGDKELCRRLKNGAEVFDKQTFSAQNTVSKQVELYKKILPRKILRQNF